MITFENVSKTFAQRHNAVNALKNISCEIKEGEFLSIIGPSGSGKSTFLLTLGGMSAPSGGKILWDDESIYHWKLPRLAEWRARKVGFVFQTFNLIPYLNVFENVHIALDLSMNNNRNGKDVHSILEQMKLLDRLEHIPNELSVGQQQRVALARALVKKPSIILADEPTGNLDPETASEIMDILIKANQSGTTVVLITHDPNLAKIANRTIRIVDGEICA